MISGQKDEKKVGKKVGTREKSRDARNKSEREKKVGTREKSRKRTKTIETREKRSGREKNEEQYFDGTNRAP